MLSFPWLQDEKFDAANGPSISDLVAKETVDKLTYMGWELDQGANPVKVCRHLKSTYLSIFLLYSKNIR